MEGGGDMCQMGLLLAGASARPDLHSSGAGGGSEGKAQDAVGAMRSAPAEYLFDVLETRGPNSPGMLDSAQLNNQVSSYCMFDETECGTGVHLIDRISIRVVHDESL